MRRQTAAAAVALLIAGGYATATTASSSAPSSTAGYNAVSVTGATMKGIGYDVVAGTITGFTVQLKGPQVKLGVPLFSNVAARFGDDPERPCIIGLYNALADQTPVVCTGFTQRSQASWRLTITVS